MRLLASICILTFTALNSLVSAEPFEKERALKFAYDVDFEMNFDNREYAPSAFSGSRTIFGARLTPSVGLKLNETSGGEHRLMFGIDVMKDFGDSPVQPSLAQPGNTEELSRKKENLDLFHEITLYYKYLFSKGKSDIAITAGIFPRRFLGGDYSRAFFSDSLRFYDNNIEGILFSVTRPASYYEVGCDWMGMHGVDRRERFMIFYSARGKLSDMFSIGLGAYLYHFAGAENVSGVVDNALMNPYVKTDLSGKTSLQRLDFTLGWLQSFQNDRRNVGRYVFPGGGELLLEVRNWNVGLRNRLYYGTNLMPYYGSTDAAGTSYGNRLYFGDPFWQLGTSGPGRYGIYDRLDVYYEPRIAPVLDLRIAASFHFNGKSSGGGWQQTVSLLFDLESLMSQSSHGR